MDWAEFRKALVDRFEGYELVELLDIPAEDVVSAFEDHITDDDNREFLEDYLRHGR